MERGLDSESSATSNGAGSDSSISSSVLELSEIAGADVGVWDGTLKKQAVWR